jgi:hypothetical protein
MSTSTIIHCEDILSDLQQHNLSRIDSLYSTYGPKWWHHINLFRPIKLNTAISRIYKFFLSFKKQEYQAILRHLVCLKRYDFLMIQDDYSDEEEYLIVLERDDHYFYVLCESVRSQDICLTRVIHKKIKDRELDTIDLITQSFYDRIVHLLVYEQDPELIVKMIDFSKTVSRDVHTCFTGTLEKFTECSEDHPSRSSTTVRETYTSLFYYTPLMDRIAEIQSERQTYEVLFSDLYFKYKEERSLSRASFVIVEMVLSDILPKDILKHVLYSYLTW